MSGVKHLLDTNFIWPAIEINSRTIGNGGQRALMAHQYGFSAVTRMELLGYLDIMAEEDALIQQQLGQFMYLAIPNVSEDKAIEVRRCRWVKLPDALIAATALCCGVDLFTMDVGVQSVLRNASEST